MKTDAQMAGMTLALLKRVQLTGEEVPAFVEINNWLNAMASDKQPEPKD